MAAALVVVVGVVIAVAVVILGVETGGGEGVELVGAKRAAILRSIDPEGSKLAGGAGRGEGGGTSSRNCPAGEWGRNRTSTEYSSGLLEAVMF